MSAGITIDLRDYDAKQRGNAPEPDAIPFDLSGCAALIQAIKPHSDAIRDKANERDKVRST